MFGERCTVTAQRLGQRVTAIVIVSWLLAAANPSRAQPTYTYGNYLTANTNALYEYTPDGTLVRSVVVTGLPEGTKVWVWGFTPDRRLLVSTDQPGASENVFELDDSLSIVQTYSISGGPYNSWITDAVVGPDNNVYAVYAYDVTGAGNPVYIFDRETASNVGSFQTAGIEGVGLTFNPDGYLYCTGWGTWDFARYQSTYPFSHIGGPWHSSGPNWAYGKVRSGANGHLFASHYVQPLPVVEEWDVTSSPANPVIVQSYSGFQSFGFDLDAAGDVVIATANLPPYQFLRYSTTNGQLLSTVNLSPAIQPNGIAVVRFCSPVVQQYVISDEPTATYAAVDQLADNQAGPDLNASMRYQMYNVVNPQGEIDQLFLAADWTVLSTIYNGNPGGCPGVTNTWSASNINLCNLTPGTHTLYAVRTAATSENAGRYHYETEHGGWRVAIGLLDLGADCDTNGVPDVCQPDTDSDGAIDACDNCPDVYNPDQADCDGDGIGDVCDDDRDGDGVANAVDACPDTPNCEVLADGRPRLDMNEDCEVNGLDIQIIVQQLLAGCSKCSGPTCGE